MKRIGKIVLFFVIGFSMLFVFLNVADALEIQLEPANAQREIGGKVRVHIYANSAVDLISMGIKIAFDPAVLQVTDASKYEDDADTGWVMDADGSAATTGDQYRPTEVDVDNTNGTVIMLGGNINGQSTTGFSGKVLLGWIVFKAIGNGNSYLNVDRAKYHPEHPTETFDNFVSRDGSVDEATNVPGGLGIICVADGVCVGNINGNSSVDMADFGIVRSAMGQVFPAPGYIVTADLNANGSIDMADFGIVRAQMGTSSCPDCDL